MATLSLCMIVRDEQDVLGRCLESVSGVFDEIIIVDTGSLDDTKQIASHFTDKVFDFEWIDDFAAARNHAFSLATSEFLMWLDADDIMLPQDRERLIELKQTLTSALDMVMLKYIIAEDAQGNPTFSYYRERIIRRDAKPRWQGAIHEVISPMPHTLYSDISVRHRKTGRADPGRNLRIFEKMVARGEQLDPRQAYYMARELMWARRYDEALAAFAVVIQNDATWIENRIGACRDAADCHVAQGHHDLALRTLFESLALDRPRAEVSCQIGQLLMNQGRYTAAVFWFETALSCPADGKNGAFVEQDYYGYIPYLQLCVCHSRMGEMQKAAHCNELAAEIKPDCPAVRANRTFFSGLGVTAH